MDCLDYPKLQGQRTCFECYLHHKSKYILPQDTSFISQVPSQSSGLLGDSVRVRILGKGQPSAPHWTESLEFSMFHKVAGLSRQSHGLEGNDRFRVYSPTGLLGPGVNLAPSSWFALTHGKPVAQHSKFPRSAVQG